VSHEVEEVLIVPFCLESFVRERNLVGIGSEQVEGEATQNCQIGGPVILSGPGVIFGHEDIELPVQFVFYAPMGSALGECLISRQEYREPIGALLVGGLTIASAPGVDPGDSDKIDESVLARRLFERDDEGAADLVPAVSLFFRLMETGSPVGGGRIGEQRWLLWRAWIGCP